VTTPLDPPEDDGRGWDRGRVATAVGVGAAVVLVIVFLIVGLANRGMGSSIEAALSRGDRPAAPDLTLPVLATGAGLGPVGTDVSLSDLRGKVVFVNVWASWCIPCEDEAPALEKIWRDYKDQRVVFLGIDVRDLTDDANAFIRRHKLTYPSLRDGSGNATEEGFQTNGVPESFLIDQDGNIAWRWIGPLDREPYLTDFRGVLDSVLKQ
jgi:cytochrome c biogenesis protein CcmG, thiol:disulfide interchange protein DsbE